MNGENQTGPAYSPKTLMEAVQFFADPARAHEFMCNLRWPDGNVKCPRCGCEKVRFISTRRQWECAMNHPMRRFSLKTNTVMEDSPLPLDKWLICIWMEANSKNAISSYEVHRALGITQKSAWFMLHRVRLAMHAGTFFEKFSGTVEADETYVGGKARNMHKGKRKAKGRGAVGKAIVAGLLQRHTSKGKDDKECSKVRTFVVPNAKKKTLEPIIRQHVEEGSNVYTDSLASYAGLNPEFAHDFVNHAETYVVGAVHTNGMENFWALFKRCIKGTHVSVEPFHLFRYVDAEAFRFNERKDNDGGRFIKR